MLAYSNNLNVYFFNWDFFVLQLLLLLIVLFCFFLKTTKTHICGLKKPTSNLFFSKTAGKTVVKNRTKSCAGSGEEDPEKDNKKTTVEKAKKYIYDNAYYIVAAFLAVTVTAGLVYYFWNAGTPPPPPEVVERTLVESSVPSSEGFVKLKERQVFGREQMDKAMEKIRELDLIYDNASSLGREAFNQEITKLLNVLEAETNKKIYNFWAEIYKGLDAAETWGSKADYLNGILPRRVFSDINTPGSQKLLTIFENLLKIAQENQSISDTHFARINELTNPDNM